MTNALGRVSRPFFLGSKHRLGVTEESPRGEDCPAGARGRSGGGRRGPLAAKKGRAGD